MNIDIDTTVEGPEVNYVVHFCPISTMIPPFSSEFLYVNKHMSYALYPIVSVFWGSKEGRGEGRTNVTSFPAKP